jgi:peptidoglycan/LPS O-acetylase OafA/YrhL
MTRRIAPALVLVFLAPFVGEVLLGNTPLRLILSYLIVLPMYGFGALFIRELSRRSGRGWPTILILGVAYGVAEEGLADMSLFNPNFLGLHLLGYGNLFGVGWPWWFFVLTLHAVWSIGVSIALAETLFAPRGEYPWLGRMGLVTSSVVFVLGVVLVHFVGGEGYQLSGGQLALSLVLVALIAAAAFLVPRRRVTQATDPRQAPNPWLAGAVAFVLTSAFMALTRLSYLLKLPAAVLILAYFLLYGLALFAVWRWSRRIGWSAEHKFALAAGALLTYVWYGFVQAPHDALDLIGQAIFALLALGLLILAGRHVRTDNSELGESRPVSESTDPLSSRSFESRSL